MSFMSKIPFYGDTEFEIFPLEGFDDCFVAYDKSFEAPWFAVVRSTHGLKAVSGRAWRSSDAAIIEASGLECSTLNEKDLLSWANRMNLTLGSIFNGLS